MDEVIGHMREKIEIPKKNEIEIYNRKKPSVSRKNINLIK